LSSDTHNNLIVAAIQMVSGRQLDENLATAAQLIAEAVKQGAQLMYYLKPLPFLVVVVNVT
jgi:hypothetical protein